MSKSVNREIAIVILLLSAPFNLQAQADQDSDSLEEIIVTSTRLEAPKYEVPAAVSIVAKDDIQLGRQQLGLDESLNRVPGIFSQNRYNFTQDLRISIRGFGARSSFGIRGIKIFADEIPATLADGQGGVDDIDLGSAARIEVIRGPSSSIFGSSSGGAISIYTEDGPEIPFIEAGVTAGEYDHQKYQLKSGGKYNRLNYLFNASHLTMDGYRDHSEVEHNLINTKFRFTIDDSSTLTMIFNAVDSPTANDAGAITAEEAALDPTQAQERNLSSNAGEELEQQKIGFVYHKQFNEQHAITLRNYYLWRDFETFLPFGSHIAFVPDDGVTAFDRFFYGGGAQYIFTGNLMGMPNRFTAGVDIDIQEDDRQRFINDAGVKGALTFDQLEEAESYGFYFRNELAVIDSVKLTVGGRYDRVDLSVDDRFLSNADQSGSLEFDEFSPSVGILWSPRPEINLYANYSTSFETPTFTELSNPARNLNVNLGGFSNVNAQTAESYEIGMKGNVLDRIDYEISLYIMNVEDEITNISNLGSRAFFENADTDRNGLEAAMTAELVAGLTLTAAYTYSDFEFDSFPSDPTLVGNSLPGLPEQQFFTELAYRHDAGFYCIWDFMYVDGLYANNSNTVKTDAYTLSNLRAGYQATFSNIEVSPFIGINNLFDEEYFSNVRINAFGGRLFEPAPELNIYGGLSLKYNFN